jgi:hypothetical protein
MGGATFKKFNGVQIAGGLIGFLAQVTGGTGATKISAANDIGLWLKADSNALICSLREGDPIASGSGDARTIKTLVSFAAGAGSPGQGRGWLSNPYGFVLPALVILSDSAKTQAIVGGIDDDPLILSLGGSTTLGQPALTGATFQSYSFPAYTSGPNTYGAAFLGSLTLGTGTPAATKLDARGIFQTPRTDQQGFSYTAVARLAGAAPGTGGTFSVLKDPVLDAEGGLAFPATIKGTGIKGAAVTTLWWKPAGANAASLFAQGGPITGGVPEVNPAAEWKTFPSLAIAATRGPIFTATLAAGRGGVLKAQTSGVWAVDFAGDTRRLFQSGVTKLAIDNVPANDKTLKSFTLLTAVTGSVGVTRSFNDAGDVTWLATFTDGTTALVKTVVP